MEKENNNLNTDSPESVSEDTNSISQDNERKLPRQFHGRVTYIKYEPSRDNGKSQITIGLSNSFRKEDGEYSNDDGLFIHYFGKMADALNRNLQQGYHLTGTMYEHNYEYNGKSHTEFIGSSFNDIFYKTVSKKDEAEFRVDNSKSYRNEEMIHGRVARNISFRKGENGKKDFITFNIYNSKKEKDGSYKNEFRSCKAWDSEARQLNELLEGGYYFEGRVVRKEYTDSRNEKREEFHLVSDGIDHVYRETERIKMKSSEKSDVKEEDEASYSNDGNLFNNSTSFSMESITEDEDFELNF